jgi:adenosine deaminase
MSHPKLPFIDLHRHLDGNIRLQTMLDLARQHSLKLPGDTLATLAQHVQVQGPLPDLLAFLVKVDLMVSVLADYDACRRIARENVEDAEREGLDYVELRFSPYFMARQHRLDPAKVVEAVAAGIAEGRARAKVQVKLIGILSRTFGAEACMIELNALLTQRAQITALDLAGDEKNFPAALFVEHFKRGRDAGWAITVHAGEAGGAPSIWAAIRELGATRIGHCVRAVDDPKLMDYLREHRIGIEANLTSNVQTNTVKQLRDHPMKRFLADGLLATLNTDDPVISDIDLKFEFEKAAPAAGLTPGEIAQAQGNALEIAFLTSAERAALLAAKSPHPSS